MRLAQHNDMVRALAPDSSDESFGKAVLPRRTWRDGLVADAHGSQSVRDGGAVDLVPITDQVAGSPRAVPHRSSVGLQERAISIASTDGSRLDDAPESRGG